MCAHVHSSVNICVFKCTYIYMCCEYVGQSGGLYPLFGVGFFSDLEFSE